MSVTFYVATTADTPRTFRLTCEVQGELGEWTGHDNAYGEAKAHALVCTDDLCCDYGATVEETTKGSAEVNLNNRNAKRILTALGYITDADIAADHEAHKDAPAVLGIRPTSLDLAGQDTAANFLGRVLIALAISPADEGMPNAQPARNFIAFGWDAGDLQKRLGALRELAEVGAAQGLNVAWA